MKSSCCISEANIMLYANYTSITTKKESMHYKPNGY